MDAAMDPGAPDAERVERWRKVHRIAPLLALDAVPLAAVAFLVPLPEVARTVLLAMAVVSLASAALLRTYAARKLEAMPGGGTDH
jgi:hypothetical protein